MLFLLIVYGIILAVERNKLKTRAQRFVFGITWLILLIYELVFVSIEKMMPLTYVLVELSFGWLNQFFSFKS